MYINDLLACIGTVKQTSFQNFTHYSEAILCFVYNKEIKEK